MSNLIHEIIALIGDAAIGLLAVAATWLTTKAAGWVKNQTVAGIIIRTDDAAVKIVRDVFAAWVEPRRRDGEWDDVNKNEAKRRALEALKEFIGVKGLSELLGVFGGNILARDNYLGATVENAITVSKNEAALVSRLDPEKKP